VFARGVGLLCPSLALAGCSAILGEYSVDEASQPGECAEDGDCDTALNEGCDDGRCAIRCLTDDPCPMYSECFGASYCTEPIGTPCQPDASDPCGGYACVELDVNEMPVEPYCPGYCTASSMCPPNYECSQLRCYKQ